MICVYTRLAKLFCHQRFKKRPVSSWIFCGCSLIHLQPWGNLDQHVSRNGLQRIGVCHPFLGVPSVLRRSAGLAALEFLGCQYHGYQWHVIEVKSIKSKIFLGIYVMYHTSSNGKVAKRIMYNHFDNSIAVTTLPFASHFIAGEKHMCTNLETTRLLMVMILLCFTKGQQYILGQSGACLII